MLSTSSTLKKLKESYPEIRFEPADTFFWSPSTRTVFYADNGEETLLLHEVAHAVLGHKEYRRDIELLGMEREAWDYAISNLSNSFGVPIDIDSTENLLDTYREWLHARSICPHCDSTGLQTDKRNYYCPACTSSWRVNEARTCALRRYLQSGI